MKYGLTLRQQKCLNFVEAYIEKHGESPTIREIDTGLGLNSTSDVHRLIIALEERGAIVRLPFRKRSLRIVQ